MARNCYVVGCINKNYKRLADGHMYCKKHYDESKKAYDSFRKFGL